MLDSKWLQDAPEIVVELFSQVEIAILQDMARRITRYDYFIPAAQHQRRILEAVGESRKAITKALSDISGESESAIRKLIAEAGNRTIESDTKYYKAAEIYAADKVDTAALNAVLRSGLRQTLGEFKNITRTTVRAGGNQLYNVLNSAWLQVSTGAFDAETAIVNAVKQLAGSGLNAVDYPSGRHDTLEVAVRRAVLTGVNQTALRLQDEYADELDCDLVETTAHAGARPSHAVWQGKVFSRSGKSTKYPNFRAVTGYGTVTGLGGVNCRHSYGPYVEGAPHVWTDEQLKKLEEKSISYNGERLTEYDASQRQRAIERKIRQWKRAEALGVDGASEKVVQWQETQRDFIRQTGLRRQYSREQVNVLNLSKANVPAGGKAKVYSASTSKNVLSEYLSRATPGTGSISFDPGYNKNSHANEVKTAQLLFDTFGGDIILLNESDVSGEKRADYLWNGQLWDLKNTSTAKAADSAIRKGLKQIAQNPGGIILDYANNEIDFERVRSVVDGRMNRAKSISADVMIIHNDSIQAVLRYKK